MKRHRFLTFSIDSTRSFFDGHGDSAALEKHREERRQHISEKYGTSNFDAKFERWLAVPKPNLSVVDEHTYLLQDIEDAYVSGNLYSALTGACCLGERIFNQIIFRIRNDYSSSSRYKEVYRRDSINDWNLGIGVLLDWQIINGPTEAKYRRLAVLRNESVHFQSKEQDLAPMAREAIELINQIVSDLFALTRDKLFLIWFEVPGELYLRKEAENVPFIRGFYIPCAPLVGFKHSIESVSPEGILNLTDNATYQDEEVSDAEFVRLRNDFRAAP